MDDDALMKKAANGDIESFGTLVRAHQRKLLRFAERMLGDKEAAEDAVQEAFLRLWQVRARYEPRECLIYYLLHIVRNCCLDHVRLHRKVESLSEESGDPMLSRECLEEKYQSRALAEAVRQAVLRLPEQQRVVFTLSHFEGMSYQEIADVLECPIGTVASRKHFAMERLRRDLRSWMEEDTP